MSSWYNEDDEDSQGETEHIESASCNRQFLEMAEDTNIETRLQVGPVAPTDICSRFTNTLAAIGSRGIKVSQSTSRKAVKVPWEIPISLEISDERDIPELTEKQIYLEFNDCQMLLHDEKTKEAFTKDFDAGWFVYSTPPSVEEGDLKRTLKGDLICIEDGKFDLGQVCHLTGTAIFKPADFAMVTVQPDSQDFQGLDDWYKSSRVIEFSFRCGKSEQLLRAEIGRRSRVSRSLDPASGIERLYETSASEHFKLTDPSADMIPVSAAEDSTHLLKALCEARQREDTSNKQNEANRSFTVLTGLRVWSPIDETTFRSREAAACREFEGSQVQDDSDSSR